MTTNADDKNAQAIELNRKFQSLKVRNRFDVVQIQSSLRLSAFSMLWLQYIRRHNACDLTRGRAATGLLQPGDACTPSTKPAGYGDTVLDAERRCRAFAWKRLRHRGFRRREGLCRLDAGDG